MWDGGYLISGVKKNGYNWKSESGNWIIRTDYKGDTLWTKRLNNFPMGKFITKNNFIYSVRSTYHDTISYQYVISFSKHDENCNLIWNRIYPVDNSGGDIEIRKTNDDGFLLTIDSQGAGLVAIKTDSCGVLEWKRLYKIGNYATYGNTGEELESGNFIFGGILTNLINGKPDDWRPFILFTDQKGDSLFTIDINEYSSANVISTKTPDNKILMAVTTGRGILILKISKDSNIEWEKTCGYKKYVSTGVRDINVTDDGEILLTGCRYYGNFLGKLLYIKLSSDGELTSIEESENSDKPEKFTLYQNYPNPFNPQTTIEYAISEYSKVKLQVFTANGEKVATLVDEFKNSGHHQIQFNSEHLSSGIYIYRLKTKNKVFSKKMLLIK